MPFRPPSLNLICRLWRAAAGPPFPPAAPQDLTFPCQLRNPSKAQLAATAVTGSVINALLACPPGTDIRGYTNTTVGDLVECPLGSGRFYKVLGVEDVAKGFRNEYRLAVVQQQTHVNGGWPFPTP